MPRRGADLPPAEGLVSTRFPPLEQYGFSPNRRRYLLLIGIRSEGKRLADDEWAHDGVASAGGSLIFEFRISHVKAGGL